MAEIHVVDKKLTFNTAAMGATYGFSKSAAANLREKDDSWNPAIAGFLAGAVGGLKCESFFSTMIRGV